MTRSNLIRTALALFSGLLAITALSNAGRRDSRFYHLLSAIISPATELLIRTDESSPVEKRHRANPENPMEPPWKWFRRELVEVIDTDGFLSVAATRESVWFKNQRGPMLYRYLTGDASVIASVRTRKRSDADSPPDREWQFAGIILRDPRSDAVLGREDYVFNVVGYRGLELSVETKSTTRGASRVDSWSWATGDAELRIDRKGSRFLLFARPRNTASWRHLITYDRPDLPERVQLGLIIYAHSEGRGIHDLQASFDRLIIE